MKLKDLPLGSEYLKEVHHVCGIDYTVLKQNERIKQCIFFLLGKRTAVCKLPVISASMFSIYTILWLPGPTGEGLLSSGTDTT